MTTIATTQNTVAAPMPMETSATARKAMIDSQLRPSGVNDPRVLAVMARVPREQFVPQDFRASAYIDRALPLDEGRSLAAPLVHGLMLTEAKPTAADKALLIGDADGYLAALLSQLAGSLDSVEPGAVSAKQDGGPYSLIVVDGAAEELPASLAALLADDGRIVTGMVSRNVTRLAVGRKTGDAIALLPLAEIGMPVLAEFAAPRRWSF